MTAARWMARAVGFLLACLVIGFFLGVGRGIVSDVFHGPSPVRYDAPAYDLVGSSEDGCSYVGMGDDGSKRFLLIPRFQFGFCPARLERTESRYGVVAP